MASIRTAGLTKDYGWMSVALGIAAAAAAVALLVDVSEIAAVCESQESSHRHPSGPRFSRHSSGTENPRGTHNRRRALAVHATSLNMAVGGQFSEAAQAAAHMAVGS